MTVCTDCYNEGVERGDWHPQSHLSYEYIFPAKRCPRCLRQMRLGHVVTPITTQESADIHRRLMR